jgi:cation diffusion facilitator CzcD-associated flavoprotein CzcO
MHSYLNKVADQYDVKRYVKLSHVFKQATWQEQTGKWEVTILRLEDGYVS